MHANEHRFYGLWAILFPVGRVQLEAQNYFFFGVWESEFLNFFAITQRSTTLVICERFKWATSPPASRCPPCPTERHNRTRVHQFSAKGQLFLIKIAGGAWVSHNTPWTGDQTGHTARSRLFQSPWAVGENTHGHKLSIHAPETSEQQLQPVPARQVAVYKTDNRLVRRSCGTWSAHFLLSLSCYLLLFCHISGNRRWERGHRRPTLD